MMPAKLAIDPGITPSRELTEEEKHALEKKKEAFDKLLANEQKAKYKLEVMFRHTRRLHGLVDGMLSIWESGTRLNGEGDTKAYFCPGKEKGVNDCEALIPDNTAFGSGRLACPACGKVWKSEEVYGEIFFKIPNERWADVLVKFYARLGHNADIYLKYPKYDVRKIAAAEQAKELRGEQYNKLRGEKVLYIYPLKNIIKDTSNGSDLYKRFYALLTA